ncbi:MAG: tetraacyldisaccharide 4'-kinase [Planctomycetes bacterium]|nr:tetraacyldisaccharide 4'-kinase [Planctomycetota bacterium]
MTQRDFIELISGRKRGLGASLLRLILWWCSLYYTAAVILRLSLYRAGILKRHKVVKPVICVGNLTAGGTGKTPCVAAIVKMLGSDAKPAIVSRGYRSPSAGSGQGNDEMRVLEELCPKGTPHIQNPDRVAGARAAVAAGAGVIVLDDGFSHLRLERDLDIVLLDALNPFGYEHMLPRGLKREPRSSLRRAGIVVVTRADVATPQRLHDLDDAIKCTGYSGPILHAAHVPVQLVKLATRENADLGALKDKLVAPFCGIGNPAGFQHTLEKLGAKVTPLGTLALGDHAELDTAAWTKQISPFLRAALEAGAVMAVCTQKDAVKLRDRKLEDAGMPIFELRVEFRFLRGESELASQLADVGGDKG